MSLAEGLSMPREQLTALYEELRGLAHHFFSAQKPDHTLQPTALVHEAYLRLVDKTQIVGLSRPQLLCTAARAMRSVLVDHARHGRAQKRGGGQERVPLDDSLALYEGRAIDLLALDEALEHLGRQEPRLAQIVELRFFGGLTEQEIALSLDCSVRTVRRDWRLARRYLGAELRKDQ
jgi:RNA polymerase sigma factor (TIGR02999 family)